MKFNEHYYIYYYIMNKNTLNKINIESIKKIINFLNELEVIDQKLSPIYFTNT